MKAEPMFLDAGRLHFDLHPGHIDPGGAFAFAGFARHTKLHRVRHLVRCQGIRPQLARNGEPQRVRTAPGQVLFLAGHPGRTGT